MRYLRLFLEHNEYYFSIDEEEFGKSEENPVKIEKKYVDTIRSVIKKDKWKISCFSDGSAYDAKTGTLESEDEDSYDYIEIRGGGRYDVFTIYMSSDEWFYVLKDIKMNRHPVSNVLIRNYNLFYKCDQFEGLLKLLSDYGVIKK